MATSSQPTSTSASVGSPPPHVEPILDPIGFEEPAYVWVAREVGEAPDVLSICINGSAHLALDQALVVAERIRELVESAQ